MDQYRSEGNATATENVYLHLRAIANSWETSKTSAQRDEARKREQVAQQKVEEARGNMYRYTSAVNAAIRDRHSTDLRLDRQRDCLHATHDRTIEGLDMQRKKRQILTDRHQETTDLLQGIAKSLEVLPALATKEDVQNIQTAVEVSVQLVKENFKSMEQMESVVEAIPAVARGVLLLNRGLVRLASAGKKDTKSVLTEIAKLATSSTLDTLIKDMQTLQKGFSEFSTDAMERAEKDVVLKTANTALTETKQMVATADEQAKAVASSHYTAAAVGAKYV